MSKEQQYKDIIVIMSDDQLKEEAQTQLMNEAHWKLDLIVDECERRNRIDIMDEVYIWYSLST